MRALPAIQALDIKVISENKNTESFFTQDICSAVGVLEKIHGLGIALALDDFGTGYSSLSYLRQLPFDVLKIDRAFVTDVAENSDAASIAKTIVHLTQNLNLGLVAEGIETAPQLAHFSELRCDEAQGFYFSKALPPEGISELLAQSRSKQV